MLNFKHEKGIVTMAFATRGSFHYICLGYICTPFRSAKVNNLKIDSFLQFLGSSDAQSLKILILTRFGAQNREFLGQGWPDDNQSA